MNGIVVVAQIIFFIFLSLAPYYILFAVIWYIKRRGFLSRSAALNLARFALVFAVLNVITDIIRRVVKDFAFPVFLTSPLTLIQAIVPAMIAVWLVLQILPSPLAQSDNPDSKSIVILKQAVEKLLSSENFLTALRTTLPKGEKDAEQGLDYIPFMLHNINERRKYFEKTSFVYLALTILIGLVFSIVIVTFGYILINDEAAGTPRTIAQIREEVSVIRRELNLALSDYFANEEFQKLASSTIKQLESLQVGDSNRTNKTKILDSINEAKKTGNITGILNNLATIEKEFSRSTELDQKYFSAITETKFSIERFLRRQEAAIPNLNTSLEKLDKLIASVNASLGKSEAQTAEVIKRLALSLVISSFFLVILRYVAGIYRNHYQEMLQAQQDDLAVRRFYVSFKGSESDPTTRTKIISDFFSPSASASQKLAPENSTNESDLSKEDVSNLLKELLGVLVKKL